VTLDWAGQQVCPATFAEPRLGRWPVRKEVVGFLIFQYLESLPLTINCPVWRSFWTFFLAVGVSIGLLAGTVGSISGGEIGTRHWTGEQGAAAGVVAQERPAGKRE